MITPIPTPIRSGYRRTGYIFVPWWRNGQAVEFDLRAAAAFLDDDQTSGRRRRVKVAWHNHLGEETRIAALLQTYCLTHSILTDVRQSGHLVLSKCVWITESELRPGLDGDNFPVPIIVGDVDETPSIRQKDFKSWWRF